MLHPWTDGQENRPVAIDMIEPVLWVIFHHKDHRVFPAWAIGNEFHGASKGVVVILDEAFVRPQWSSGIYIESTTTMIIRIEKINVCGQFAHFVIRIDILTLKHLLKTAEPIESSRIFRKRRIRYMRVVIWKQVIAVVAHHF